MTLSKFYSFAVTDLRGKAFDLNNLQGKVVVIVNTATKCGFTPQLVGLEKIYNDYKDRGLVVLGFPSNSFYQEVADSDEVGHVCQINFGVSFPLMAMTDVNGPNSHPLFEWIKAEKPGFLGLKRIKWNFEKFVISKDGRVVERYSSLTTPDQLIPIIEKELAK